MQVYNTLSGKKESFKPLNPPTIKMYCCGPTVYDFLHVGNFRGAVVYHLCREWLERQHGYKVQLIYNFTDIDDKILQKAQELKIDWEEVAEKYIATFWEDFNALQLRAHSANPRATQYIDAMIGIIKKLIEEKKAYVAKGDVIYSIDSFKGYGKLSHKKIEELEAGSRVAVDDKKKNPLDFVLWKKSKEGEPSWESPWGKGRPGWHIECSAMNHALLGEQIDIHGGGRDLIFPHHENEIAQSEAFSGRTFAKYWIHTHLITFSGQKMSKSLGNIYCMRSFLQKYSGELFKFFVLSVHYRSTLDFSEKNLQQALKQLAKIYSSLNVAHAHIKSIKNLATTNGNEAEAKLESKPKPESKLELELEPESEMRLDFERERKKAWEHIVVALDDDFNTPQMWAQVFILLRKFNNTVNLNSNSKKVFPICQSFVQLMDQCGKLCALFQEEPQKYLLTLDDMLLESLPLDRHTIQAKVVERQKARTQKDYATSDAIRKELDDLGIALSDTPQGPPLGSTKVSK